MIVLKSLIIIPKPDFHHHLTPLGPLYVASVMRKKKLDVDVLDLNSISVNLDKFLLKNRPKYCVIATSFRFYGNCPPITMGDALEIAKHIKTILKDTKTILIGPLSSVLADELIKNKEVDFVIVGEPDFAVSDLVLALEKKESLELVEGLIFKKNGKVVKTKLRDFPDLNKLPMPARDMININHYIFNSYYSERVISLLASRGCPFACTFCFISNNSGISCCNSGRFYRTNDPERLIEEILYLKRKYKIKGLKFEDPEFCVNKERIKRICELMIKKNINLKWKCQSRVTHIELPILKLMKKAGCESIYCGVESGNQDTLDDTKKDITLDEIKKAFYLIRKAKINADASFLIGLLGDDWKKIKQTVKFAKEIKPNIAVFHVYSPFPGCSITKDIKTSEKFNLNVYKADNFSLSKLSPKELEKARKYAYRSFYLRFNYIISKLFQGLRKPSLFKFMLNMFLKKQEGKVSRELITDSIR